MIFNCVWHIKYYVIHCTVVVCRNILWNDFQADLEKKQLDFYNVFHFENKQFLRQHWNTMDCKEHINCIYGVSVKQ